MSFFAKTVEVHFITGLLAVTCIALLGIMLMAVKFFIEDRRNRKKLTRNRREMKRLLMEMELIAEGRHAEWDDKSA